MEQIHFWQCLKKNCHHGGYNKSEGVNLELDPTEDKKADLRKAMEELSKFQNYEEDYWKEKSSMQWFKEGDSNTKFFHAYVKGRRKRLMIQKIENS